MLDGMALPDRIYRRTPVGEKMLTSPDRTCPLEYQRILALIDQDTHTDVVRGCLRQFPDTLLADWLAEMEELGYLSSRLTDSTQSLDFTDLFTSRRPAPTPPVQEDRKQLETQTSLAASSLGDKGVFLSVDRIRNREPLRKTAGEISVLVVEDDPDQAALADMRVSMGGYSVRLAASLEALRQELYAGRLPEILLLDIMLPDGNGFEILAALRRHPKLALLPVVMLTVITGKENVRRGLELGADGYITKPYSKKIVVETIRAVLKHS
jgi:CheY-like chemotaxis protein